MSYSNANTTKSQGAADIFGEQHPPTATGTLYSVADVAELLDLTEQANGKYHGAPKGTGKTKDGFVLCPEGNAFTNSNEKYTSRQVAELAGIDPANYEPYARWKAGRAPKAQRPAPRNAAAAPHQKQPTKSKGAPVETATHIYTDEAGEVLFRVERKKYADGSKDFPTSRPDGRGGWVYKLGDTRRVLYRLPEVLAAQCVIICEGEKDADATRAALEESGLLGEFTATTNSQGAGKWRDEYSPILAGKRVYILPDNDEPGHSHAQAVARSVAPVALETRIVELPGQGPKDGADDFLRRGNCIAELLEIAHAASQWAPSAAPAASARPTKRAKHNEPTPDEIAQTAQAVRTQSGGAKFPDLTADEIPAPALLTGEKPEYDPFQLRELVRPSGTTVSLCTEAAHAERAAQYIGANVLFCPELGFLHFDAMRGFWRADDKDGTLTAAKLMALAPIIRAEAAALLRYAATLAAASRDADARAMSRAANEVLTHAKQIEKQSFLSGAAKFLAADRRAEVEKFAPVAWKFAFKNRVFDRGQWRAAQRDDFLLHVSPVEMHRDADRREWCALLNRITAGDADLCRTLQDVCAYILSGASSLRAIAWFFGGKGTGKSTFCELLQTLLGNAAATIDTALLQDASSRERLGAQLVFKRGAFVSEAGNKRIEAELLKTLSGGDRLSVRFLYREAFTAKPSHALVLAANDAPRTDAYDDALRDRVIALPFVHPLREGEPLQFEGHKRIETARLDPDSDLLRGFAVWIAEGLERLYQSQEIYKAPAAEAATAQFWEDTDPLTPFWETIDETQFKGNGIGKSALRRLYEQFCSERGERPVGSRQFMRACKERPKGKLETRVGNGNFQFWVFATPQP